MVLDIRHFYQTLKNSKQIAQKFQIKLTTFDKIIELFKY